MILKNSLYTIVDKRTEGSSVCYQILLDKNHFIYQAHFPHEPITPGACIIQISKELFEDHFQEAYEISVVKNVKFLSVILPLSTPVVSYVFDKITILPETGEYKTQVHIQGADTLYAKISIIFRKIRQ